MKKINKKRLYAFCIVILLVILVVLSSSCSDSKGEYCIPPKVITGICHTSCGSPSECQGIYTGGKGPGCSFGQVCDDNCTCVWVDKDIDGFPSKNVGYMNYSLDCDDEDPTVFPGAPEICDNKDNDCDSQIDEDGICNKDVYFCKTDAFSNETRCSGGEWCSASTLNTSASCNYTTTMSDLGKKDVYTYVCDNYPQDGDFGCFKFIEGYFTVLSRCDEDNVKDANEECDGTDIGGKTCAGFGYTGGNLGCDHCTFDFDGCIGGVCDGDNVKDNGEECDGTDLNGKTCQYFGLSGNGLECNNACLFDKSGCVGSVAVCGNNVVEPGETCDDSELNGLSCNDFDGYTGGSLSCYAPGAANECHYNTTACTPHNPGYCGNGLINDGEECDKSNLDGKSCSDFDNFINGSLGCYLPGDALECLFDTNSCILPSKKCNNGIVEPPEECDSSNLNGRNCKDLGFVSGNLSCMSNCTYDYSNCVNVSCLEEWTCASWSNCSKMSGNTTRVCTDGNHCNTNYSKPAELKPCDPGVCVDDDNDGYCACFGQALGCDCNDKNAAVHPEASESCNGQDDNCDGTIDESCTCDEGANRTCGVNEGLCREGRQTCMNGFWSLCSGSYIGPRSEVCDNGIDEDCDGYSDEGCTCVDNSTQECGTDVGECEIGTQFCFASNWSACSGSVDPVSEVCTGGKDEDCDATLDCDDESCSSSYSCTGTPGPGTPGTCFDKKKNQAEEGVDCGGPCPSCDRMCGQGQIKKLCLCDNVKKESGYCCDGGYSEDSCTASCTDSDGDTLCDDDEIRDGTDPNNADTDGDGMPDNGDDAPLCNKDGKCDSAREYPETPENCPDDCGEKESEGLGLLWWVIIILLILIVLAAITYYLVKKGVKGKKKKEEPKFVLSKPVFRSTLQQTITPIKKGRDTSKLVDYLEKSMKSGVSRLKLRESSLKGGWTSDETNKAFDTIDQKKKRATRSSLQS